MPDPNTQERHTLKKITLTVILDSNKLLGMSTTTLENYNILFSEIARDASRPPSVSLVLYDKYPFLYGSFNCPNQANCIMPLSNPIGPFKLIV